MNYFLSQSIDLANQRDYLDQLFRVYPMSLDNLRIVKKEAWDNFEEAFNKNDQELIIESLFDFNLFPIKDSYISYLRHDRRAIRRNPNTIARICGRLREIGLDKIYENISQPKETNRQIGPLFKRWIKSGVLGIPFLPIKDFMQTEINASLDASDSVIQEFSKTHLGYNRKKGIDFIARINGKFIIGEAKFLTDFGGHQNAQFNDAIELLKAKTSKEVIKVAILDGICYMQKNSKMHLSLIEEFCDENIFSSLFLRDFIFQV